MKILFKPTIAVLSALCLMSGCTSKSTLKESPAAHSDSNTVFNLLSVIPFSQHTPNNLLPKGWNPWIVTRNKKLTNYRLVNSEHGTVIHAKSSSAASGLMQPLSIELNKQTRLNWKWKINHLIETADNTQPHTEDAPVRIILAFDGDKQKLTFKDSMSAEMVKLLTGQDMPYATLMYIWENHQPVNTIIANQHSGRIKMIVAESGSTHVGKWQHYQRQIADDFQAAFGELPGKLIGIGIFSDTDNTGKLAESWYGDISLQQSNEMTE